MSPILDDPFPLGDDELSKKLAARRAALQQSYNTNALEAEATPELSGTQIGASAAIKLLPLLLGMAIAKRRNVGAALGADAGLKYSGEYEKGELADQESKIKQSGLRANQALKDLSTIDNQSFQLAKQKDTQRYQDRSREDTQTFQGEQGRLNRNAANERARLARQGSDPELDPLVQSGLTKRQNGQPLLPEEQAAMNKTYKSANLFARIGENADVNTRAATRLEYMNKIYQTKQDEKQIFGTEDTLGPDGKKMTQSASTADKARVAIESNRVVQGSLDSLVNSYKKSGGRVILGEDRQLQDAEASMVWSYMRNVLKTGMRLEGKEQKLVNSLAVASYDLDGFLGTLSNEFQKGGAEETARTLKDIVNRSTQERLLSANKKFSGTSVPGEGSPSGGGQFQGAPQGLSFDEFKAWKKSQGR